MRCGKSHLDYWGGSVRDAMEKPTQADNHRRESSSILRSMPLPPIYICTYIHDFHIQKREKYRMNKKSNLEQLIG